MSELMWNELDELPLGHRGDSRVQSGCWCWRSFWDAIGEQRVDVHDLIAPPLIATIPAAPMTLADVEPFMVYRDADGDLSWSDYHGNVVCRRSDGRVAYLPKIHPDCVEITGPCLGHVRDVLRPATETADDPMTLDELAGRGVFVVPSMLEGRWRVGALDGQRVSWSYSDHLSLDDARVAATEIARKRVTT